MIKIGSSAEHISVYTCQPKSKDDLVELIQERIFNEGSSCDLNDIDVSLIDDMHGLFYMSDFTGDISKWNTSNVKNMSYMFSDSTFNGDISEWDVSNVEEMNYIFSYSNFNSDVSRWDVSKVENMFCAFSHSGFVQDISNWNINKDCDTEDIFLYCPIKKEHKPKILQYDQDRNLNRSHINLHLSATE